MALISTTIILLWAGELYLLNADVSQFLTVWLRRQGHLDHDGWIGGLTQDSWFDTMPDDLTYTISQLWHVIS